MDKLQVDKRIQGRVKKQMERAQKEYYLNEKMKAIQKELGRKDERVNEVDELRKKIEGARMSKEAEEKALQELKRLESMPPMSAEATVSRNYLDWLIAVPWQKKTRERKDLLAAEQILNDDHYGLEKVKERIVEFLAVRQLVNNPKGPILCFVGPPGVGKTSLAKSIARATNRKFVRLSLGGVRDEAEVRGHRRTYIGAFPGQIIQMMKKAGSRNPVFLLDEVDKMSMDFRGDPSAALLEVLDPEQNHSFTDHYLDVEFDLSSVFFIATANVLHTIPQALQDRLEVIRLPGYTEHEKVEIAKRHLIAKQTESHGLKPKNVSFTDAALTGVVRQYTREAGVRNFEREISTIFRKVARKVVLEGKDVSVEVTDDSLPVHLGVPRFRSSRQEERNEIGTATGLAWTEVGGEILPIEVTLMHGQGRAQAHGQAGRRHAGIGPRGDERRALARRGAGPQERLQSPGRRAHPRARGRHPQGRPFRRHHHGHRPRLRLHQEAGAARRGHDRRDHAPGQGASHRRREGEAAGRPSHRGDHDHPAPGEREGPGRRAEERPRDPDRRPGGSHRRSAEDRPRAPHSDPAAGHGRDGGRGRGPSGRHDSLTEGGRPTAARAT